MVQVMKRDAKGNMTLDTYALDSNDPNLVGPEQVSSRPTIDLGNYQYNESNAPVVTEQEAVTGNTNTGPNTTFSNTFGSSSSPSSNPFMEATMQMLKYAQGGIADIGTQYGKAERQLQSAGQYAQDRGNIASANVLSDKTIDPRDFVSLASSAKGAYDPSVLSAERQMGSLANQLNAQNKVYENISGYATKLRDQEQARLNAEETKRSNLATERVNAYKAENPAAATSKTAIKLTPTDKQALGLSGLSPKEIAQIEADMNSETGGIEKILADQKLTTAQKTAIKEVYGETKTKVLPTKEEFEADVRANITPEEVADQLKQKYSDQELFDLAGKDDETSYWTPMNVDIERWLKSPKAYTHFLDLIYRQKRLDKEVQ